MLSLFSLIAVGGAVSTTLYAGGLPIALMNAMLVLVGAYLAGRPPESEDKFCAVGLILLSFFAGFAVDAWFNVWVGYGLLFLGFLGIGHAVVWVYGREYTESWRDVSFWQAMAYTLAMLSATTPIRMLSVHDYGWRWVVLALCLTVGLARAAMWCVGLRPRDLADKLGTIYANAKQA